MNRCIKPYTEVNHNPVAVLNGDQSKKVIYNDVRGGTVVTLDAGGSHDPDGDDLIYTWWVYSEACTYGREVFITDSEREIAKIQVPTEANGKTIHCMLTLEDKGDPTLTSYRRMVLNVMGE